MENTKEKNGIVSLTLLSLEAQVKTLFAEAGGAPVVDLLDRLCRISEQEQPKVLNIFSKMIDRVINGTIRLPDTASEQKAFEDDLYNELISALGNKDVKNKSLKLSVLEGGQSIPLAKRSVVSIADLRKAKKQPKFPVA